MSFQKASDTSSRGCNDWYCKTSNLLKYLKVVDEMGKGAQMDLLKGAVIKLERAEPHKMRKKHTPKLSRKSGCLQV